MYQISVTYDSDQKGEFLHFYFLICLSNDIKNHTIRVLSSKKIIQFSEDEISSFPHPVVQKQHQRNEIFIFNTETEYFKRCPISSPNLTNQIPLID